MTNWMVGGTLVATLIILALLISLFLIDRKHEMGIYLAIGEKKSRILGQFICEVILIALVSMTLALFVGNVLGNQLSQMMIEQDMIRQLEDPDYSPTQAMLQARGFRFDMTHEEMIYLYEVRLDRKTVLLFYSVTLNAIVVATTIPMWLVLKKDPKEVLLG